MAAAHHHPDEPLADTTDQLFDFLHAALAAGQPHLVLVVVDWIRRWEAQQARAVLARGTRFLLGRLALTPAAQALLEANAVEALTLIARHATGDWGDLSPGDGDANEAALLDGDRLLSAYDLDGGRLWVITEADRSQTTLLLPDDY
jgi:hypothetical protein